MLFLCSGLCWEFGVLCCSVVLFLVLLFENSCAFFVLWIVLEFGSLCCFLVLFLVLFFVLWIVLFLNEKKSGKGKIHQVCALDCAGSLEFCAVQLCFFWCSFLKTVVLFCALDCAGSLEVCAVFWCFLWCSFLKTVVLFLCSGLRWEFGVLCCSVALPFGHPLGKHEQKHEKSTTENSYWPGSLETRPRFVKLKLFRPAGPPWSPTASSPGLAWATARRLQLPALQRNEKLHKRQGAMAPKGNPQRIGYRIAV